MAYKSPYEGLNVGVKLTPTKKKKTTPQQALKSPYDTPSYTQQAPAKTYNFLSGGSTPTASKPLSITSPFEAQASRVNPTPSYVQTPGVTAKSGYEGMLKPPVPTTSRTRATPTPTPTPQQQYIQPAQQQVSQQPAQFDYAQMSKMIADAFAKNMPKVPEYQPYQSQLDPQIMDTLNKIRQYKEFGYDPATDPALQ